MTSSVFEPIDKSSFRIGDKIVAGHVCDPPFGKIKFIIEGTSDRRDPVSQHLFINDLSYIYPADLPNGTSIHIQNPQSDFQEVNSVEFIKSDDQSKLTIALCFNYIDWHFPINLHHFAERYINALLHKVYGAIECNVEQCEPGLFINCCLSVAPYLTLSLAYRKADSQVLATYRMCLADIYSTPTPTKEHALPQSEDSAGAKWWFRYVIVPVLGSGAVAAIAAGLMALLK